MYNAATMGIPNVARSGENARDAGMDVSNLDTVCSLFKIKGAIPARRHAATTHVVATDAVIVRPICNWVGCALYTAMG